MGCLFSKKSLSASTPPGRSSTSTRVQYLNNSNSNGIVRVPKNGPQNDQTLSKSNDESNHESSCQLRMKPPPLAPPPSPPSSFESLNAEPTEPPTPEDKRPSLYVQYVEDLQPASPVPLRKVGSTSSTADKYSRSKVSISNVTLKSNVNGIRRAPMPMQDLSIEELDTEMDETNRFRNKRASILKGEKMNPPITDVLLPRRKEPPTQEKKQQPHVAKDNKEGDEKNKVMDQNCTSSRKSLRADTPKPKIDLSKASDQNHANVSLNIEDISEGLKDDTSIKETTPSDKVENDKLTTTKLNVTNKREENIVTFDMSMDERYAESANKESLDSSTKSGHSKSTPDTFSDNHIQTGQSPRKDIVNPSSMSEHSKIRPGTLSEIHIQTTQEIQANSQLKEVRRTLYEKDLEKSRMSRKRKRTRDRKSDYIHRPGSVTLNEKGHERFPGGSLKSLKARPGSGTSSWTIDSQKSLGSTDTLHSFDIEMDAETKHVQYSYIDSGTTPISFKTFTDESTEIIDLEDHGDLNDDSWLSDDHSKPEQSFSDWYGVKPYKVSQNSGRNDAGVVKTLAHGPSSSEISTKNKLMYSRFARRPQSESVLRKGRKPPLPPGAELKMRPVSDTVNRSHVTSRYFTTDLDIH